MPHLLSKDVIKAIDSVKTPVMYVSNLVTQPGETDKYNVSDHIKKLNEYLGNHKVDVVLANNAKVDVKIKRKYFKEEKKELVKIDKKNIEREKTRLIEDNIFSIEDGTIRHNSLKTAFIIFSYLMEGE